MRIPTAVRHAVLRSGIKRPAGRIVDYPLKFGAAAMFEHLGPWVTRWVVDGAESGGLVDYNEAHTTMLRHPRFAVEVAGKSVLDLGPLEGGNTAILCEMGAKSVLGVEGRAANVARCLFIKNALGLDAARFELGDARTVSVDSHGAFDIAVATGILYHVDRPDLVLARLGEMADTLILSTHYATDRSPSQIAATSTFGDNYRGRLFREGGPDEVNSGLQSQAVWPYEPDLLRMIRAAGWSTIDVIDRPQRNRDSYALIYLVATRERPAE